MSYTVTTKRPCPLTGRIDCDCADCTQDGPTRWQRDFPEHDDATEYAANVIDSLDNHTDSQSHRREWTTLITQARDLPEQGGVIGPLPNGYGIEITRAV